LEAATSPAIGGGLILRELERHSGLLREFAGCFVDYRAQRSIEHSVQELVSQRIHGLVLGSAELGQGSRPRVKVRTKESSGGMPFSLWRLFNGSKRRRG